MIDDSAHICILGFAVLGHPKMNRWLTGRRDRLAVILLSSATMCLLRFESFQVGAFEDDAHYVVLADVLANGKGYKLIRFPEPQPERALFPWLAPVIVTVCGLLFNQLCSYEDTSL